MLSERNTKICLVSTYPPSSDALAPLTRDLAEELVKQVSVVVIAQKEKKSIELSLEGVRVYRYWTPALYPFQVLRKVLQEQPDVVHVQQELFLYGQRTYSAILFPVMLVLLRLFGRRFVLTAHHVIPPQLVASMGATLGIQFPLAAKMFLLLYYRTFMFASAVIVPRAQQKTALLDSYNLEASKVYVIPHGLRTGHTPSIGNSEARERLSVSTDHVILFFGFIRPTKGLEDLVRAVSILKSKRQELTLFVVGMAQRSYSDYFEGIRKMVLDLDLSSNVIFTGYVPEDRLPLYFSSAEVVVFPYTKMGIESSAALLKALEFARPIITTDIGEFTELKEEGVCCATVPPSDPVKLAKAIEDSLKANNKNIDCNRTVLDFAEKHKVEHLAQKYVKLYYRVIGLCEDNKIDCRSNQEHD
jgi:glycosyltransferase involved in cell wall biosynthesis